MSRKQVRHPPVVIASAAQQSSVGPRRSGLLRYARKDDMAITILTPLGLSLSKAHSTAPPSFDKLRMNEGEISIS